MSIVRIGAKIPNAPILSSPQTLRDFVIGLEATGFDYVSLDDHVTVAPPEAFAPGSSGYATVRAEHELFTTLAYLAAVTTTIELRPGVLILPQRQTALVARQAAEVDVLSNGRLTLGVGLGWNPLEFTALGATFPTRSRRFEAQIELLRKLWTNEYVTHSDEWHDLDRAGILPRPVQQPIPLWVGASAEPAIRRAARIGDGFIPLGRIGRGGEEQIAAYLDEWSRIGQQDAPLRFEGWVDLDQRAIERAADDAAIWRGYGATHLTLVTPPGPNRTAESALTLLRDGFTAIRERASA